MRGQHVTAEPKSYKLRGDNNNLLTVALFLEPWVEQVEALRAKNGSTPVFSLRGREGYIDARLTFLEERDPTGVAWALKWLEGVNHLNRLLKCVWFQECWDTWQEELDAIIQSEALAKIRGIADGASPAAFQANKFLAGKEWKKSGRGRPSKAEVASVARQLAKQNGEHEDDLARVTAGRNQLKVVQ